ncbi:hypothetical protein DFH05DRAFT_315693 [Lentinula detonsa]|uniref:DUF8040 domain-containing protein n=1 Tax=Lentinula detonsa TaxID=2804962 RepID=A0A9W8NUL8_9AGAR|nr:hypothetical protein DFH05DRAFT_315693 [Lentinula detonsa]
MVTIRVLPSERPNRAATARERVRRLIPAVAGIVSAHALMSMQRAFSDLPQPMYNSGMTGQKWIEELQKGHPVRFRRSMGMAQHVFRNLVRDLVRCGLSSSRLSTVF